MAIIDLQKRIAEGESKLKQQQNLYEAVRADRNLYSKNLIEAQDEIQEMKRKFKIMQHQIEQLKEEISAKDLALLKEHFDHQKARGRRQEEGAVQCSRGASWRGGGGSGERGGPCGRGGAGGRSGRKGRGWEGEGGGVLRQKLHEPNGLQAVGLSGGENGHAA